MKDVMAQLRGEMQAMVQQTTYNRRIPDIPKAKIVFGLREIYSFFKLQSLSAVNYAPAHRERMAILPRISKTCLPMASRRIDSLSMQKSRVDRSGLNRRAINNQGAPSADITL
ncbi:hypothetical protein K1719_003392 [Acacia pycnantha]|nr:hypothetical protein K1719_003392 [Acacia pycnantha]